jgi:hypothetical protein
MNKVLEAVAFALGVPVVVLIALFFALVISLQCWLETKHHHTDYKECTCEKDPLGCEEFPYGK